MVHEGLKSALVAHPKFFKDVCRLVASNIRPLWYPGCHIVVRYDAHFLLISTSTDIYFPQALST